MNYPQTLTILRASAADEYGNPVADWSTATETTAKGYIAKHRASVIFPPDVDVRDGDRVAYDGLIFEAEVQPVVKPSGETKFLLVALAEIAGEPA